MNDPLMDLELNCRTHLCLLEACRTYAPEAKLVFGSTRQIYGRPEYLPVDEDHPSRPVDVNGIHKLAGENYHLLYNQVYGLRSVALRMTNTYGPRMRIKDARQTFLGVWIRDALEGRVFEVWGGSQLRDFTYVDDAVEALLLAAERPEVEGGVYNISGSPAYINLTETAEILVNLTGGGFVVRDFPANRERIDIGDYYANDHRFRSLTGWKPQTSLAEGLGRTVAFFRADLEAYL